MTAQRRQIDELLVKRATEGLSPAEEVQLDYLLARHPDIDRDAFERAAATVFLAACAEPAARMPEGLRDRLQMDALSVVKGNGSAE